MNLFKQLVPNRGTLAAKEEALRQGVMYVCMDAWMYVCMLVC